MNRFCSWCQRWLDSEGNYLSGPANPGQQRTDTICLPCFDSMRAQIRAAGVRPTSSSVAELPRGLGASPLPGSGHDDQTAN